MDSYDHITPRSRKTKADVMTKEMAFKCGKTAKTHKLIVREEKRFDNTRSEHNKTKSKLRHSKQGFLKRSESELIYIE